MRLKYLLLALILASTPTFAQVTATTEPPPTVTVSASPLTGRAPLVTTLTWSSTNADSCRRGGIDVPLSGSMQITVTNDTQYVITCTGGKDYTDLTWLAPTENLTGQKDATGKCITTPIPATGTDALAGFRLIYNTNLTAMAIPPASTDCGATSTAQPIGTVINIMDPAARSYRVLSQPNGTYYYVLSALNQAGQSSSYTGPATNIVSRTSVSSSVNVNVTGFTTSATAAFNVVKRDNGFVLVQVGTVPLNTPCDITQTVNGKYAVPVSAVTWSGSVKPIVVVATCSEQ